MNRTILYQIHAKDAGICVEQFLKRKAYSRQNLAQLKRDNATLLNGGVCPLNQCLSGGDRLEVRIREESFSEKIPPVSIPLSILYEDEDLLVVNKPAGLPIHPSRDNYYYSLANAVMYYYRGQNFVFRCSNRLDRDTSGLTVIAKHPVSASALASMVKTENRNSMPVMKREYLAVACGTVTPPDAIIEAPLSRVNSEKKGFTAIRPIERCVDFKNGERAVTHYHILETKKGYTLLSILLETGRTHQIRVHMAYIGYPLAGDYLYNPACRSAAVWDSMDMPAGLTQEFPEEEKMLRIPCVTVPEKINGIARQALHAYHLKFPHPITGASMEFTAPLPDDMRVFGFQIP